MQKIMASHILANKNYYEVVDLEMKLNLRKMGYEDPLKPNFTQPNFEKYTLTELEVRMEMIKTQSKQKVEEPGNGIFHNLQPPNIVQQLNNHEAWFELGKLLRQFGDLFRAKKYLVEANKHFSALGNTEKMGECFIEMTHIAYIEGQHEEAMENALNANKLCKNAKNWRKLLSCSCQLLLEL
jgi:tetratricopeptide (TPR) repeat protein